MSRSLLAAPSEIRDRPAFDYLAGFTACSLFAALDMAGLLPSLAADGVSGERFDELERDEAQLLRAALDYLRQRGLVIEEGGAYRLSEHGRAVGEDIGYLTWLVGGYGEPLNRVAEFVAEGKRYGVDCVRNVHWLANGTAKLAGKDVVPHVLELLEQVEFGSVLDIGCGNGRFLLRVCEQFGVRGVGLDISPDAVAEARKVAATAAAGDRVEFTLGRAEALEEITVLGETDLVVTFFLLHEILASGRDVLVEWFGDLSARLPAHAHLLAGEVQPPVADGSQQPFTPEFTFVHALMRQRLFSAEEWRSALEDGGFTVRKILPSGQPGGILLLAQNARQPEVTP